MKRLKKRVFRNVASKAPAWKRKRARWMASHQTFPERLLWSRLRKKQLGVCFYRQKVIRGYIVDFWTSCGIVVEADGPCHLLRKAYDKKRDERLAEMGLRTLRFTDQEIKKNINAVVSLIRYAIKQRQHAT